MVDLFCFRGGWGGGGESGDLGMRNIGVLGGCSVRSFFSRRLLC